MPKNITAKAAPVIGIDKALQLEKGCAHSTTQEQFALYRELSYDDIVKAHCANDAIRVNITLIMARKLTQELPPVQNASGKGETHWFSVGHNENSVQGKAVTPIKKQVFDNLKTRKHSNPSVAWAQYREAGRELVFGKPEKGKNEGENRTRKFDDRIKEECAKLYLAHTLPTVLDDIKTYQPKSRQDRIVQTMPVLEKVLVLITGNDGICAKLVADRDAAK